MFSNISQFINVQRRKGQIISSSAHVYRINITNSKLFFKSKLAARFKCQYNNIIGSLWVYVIEFDGFYFSKNLSILLLLFWWLFREMFTMRVAIFFSVLSRSGPLGYFWHFVAGKQFVSVYVFYYTLWLLLYFPSNDNNIVRNYECFVCVSQLIRVINGTIETQWDRTVKRMEFNIPSCASNRGQLSQMRIYMNKVKYWWFFCNLIFQVYKLMKMMIDAGNLVQELLYDFAQNGDCFPESRIRYFTVVFFHLILFIFSLLFFPSSVFQSAIVLQALRLTNRIFYLTVISLSGRVFNSIK